MRAAPQWYLGTDGARRPWHYPTRNRASWRCYDCRRDVRLVGSIALPDHMWERINPTEQQGAGVLCAQCILERFDVLGLYDIPDKLP
jgi:hypothetical protein